MSAKGIDSGGKRPLLPPIELLALLLVALASSLSGCGSGGGGNGGSSAPSNSGFTSIISPTSDPSYATASDFLDLSGQAFISAPASSCCSASATGVTVIWKNSATGESGSALERWDICFFIDFFPCPYLSWVAGTSLVLGTNVIIVTASDSKGNSGTATLTVTRTPDVTPPTVTSTSPANGATGIASNVSIQVTFSENMDPATVTSATFLLRDQNSNLVTGTVAYANRVATFQPASPLIMSSSYTATITTGAKDRAGDNPLAASFQWSFFVGSPPDTTPPAVISTLPAPGATCVPADSPIIAAFSESIDAATVDASTFLLTDNNQNPVVGTAGIGSTTLGDNSAVLIPSLGLAPSMPFAATITTGVRDLAGNAMAADFNWSFTSDPPAGGTWSSIATTGAPTATALVSFWTGAQMIAFDTFGGSGGRYDPITNSWTGVSGVGAPAARFVSAAVWTGTEMIVWGGLNNGIFLNDGARYNPTTDTWQPVSIVGAPSPRSDATAVWTGAEMLIWGGSTSAGFANTGAKYDPGTDTWSPITTVGAPDARIDPSSTWTGSKMVVWGGTPQNGTAIGTGGVYDPATDTWEPTETVGAPSARSGHSAVWTGNKMAVWGGSDISGVPTNTGGLYDPAAKSWVPISTACAASARSGHSAVWDGTGMIIWGGVDASGLISFGIGRRYDPVSDSWSPLPFVGQPQLDSTQRAVWTGTDMIVWGRALVGLTKAGGRYRP